MTYTSEQQQKINGEHESVQRKLETLVETLLTKFHPLVKNDKAKEYLAHGVCRRLGTISRCIENIFSIFPVAKSETLTPNERKDAEINLHALVININGLQDNLALVYLHERGHFAKFKRVDIGLYQSKTQAYFPPELLAHLNSDPLKSWHARYSKEFRDALAHRIPLYIPPFALAPGDSERYRKLERLAWDCLMRHDFEGYEAALIEQDTLCKLLAVYLHSVAEDEQPDMMQLHVQILCDALTAIELVEAVQPYLIEDGSAPTSSL